MPSLNKVMLIGNLTRDPEMKTTPKGTAVGELSLAINETYKTQDGQDKETTTFVEVVTWGRLAENCQQYLAKGRPVFVEGKLQLDQWESKEGEKRSKMRVRAETVQFLPTRDRDDSAKPRQDAPPADRESSGRRYS